MASIFTYDPDPPRVSSPWLQATEATEDDSPQEANGHNLLAPSQATVSLSDDTETGRRVTRLQAEPQEGPVEYKLHLLLRPRRKFRSVSTGSHISGSRHSKQVPSPALTPSLRVVSDPLNSSLPSSTSSTPPLGLTQQTRQHRLEQLTTQLLWRLQQSSPHHTSSATNIILPTLPEALPELEAPQQPARLLHGLEESQGALYEIGVSDDGTLVGLAEDELHESLNNLRAMAACLGCTVEVLRKEVVGECEWVEETIVNHRERLVRRAGDLVVAEALISPVLLAKSPALQAKELLSVAAAPEIGIANPGTEQLRITLIGPTMSGKSTLLGTLTTSTLDNGRGKSRLSMLRHRHEITSGVTSSVTQELLGYQDSSDGSVQVINYASDNIASWIDVHNSAAGSRMVFVSDSAGHPRYKRTTIRGLVGWAPHWTLLCVPADDSEDGPHGFFSGTPPLQSHLGTAVADMDLSGAQLDLCLRLNLPLVIVITKLDLASRPGLKNSLSKVLDALKAAGRKPAILSNNTSGIMDAEELQSIPATNIEAAYNISVPLLNNCTGTVPIVLTSAVQGTGILNLHALLHELPMPDVLHANESGFVFHVEDVYSKPAEPSSIIVSGRLRSGQISVGTTSSVGPFSSHDIVEDSEDSDAPRRRSSAGLPTSRSFPGALPHLKPHYFQLPNQEWKNVKIRSIRNLRLPVHTLFADQVGTLAISLNDTLAPSGTTSPSQNPLSRIRKGMVLVAVQPIASRSFVVRLKREDLDSLAVGNHVMLYTASVRAPARVVSARAPDSPTATREDVGSENNAFQFDDISEASLDGQLSEKVAGQITTTELLVTFRWESTKEYIVLGDPVLVMPGGGPGLYGGQERGEKGIAGLEGFVGEIVEVIG